MANRHAANPIREAVPVRSGSRVNTDIGELVHFSVIDARLSLLLNGTTQPQKLNKES